MSGGLMSGGRLSCGLQSAHAPKAVPPRIYPQISTPKYPPQISTPNLHPQVSTQSLHPQVSTPKSPPQVSTPKSRGPTVNVFTSLITKPTPTPTLEGVTDKNRFMYSRTTLRNGVCVKFSDKRVSSRPGENQQTGSATPKTVGRTSPASRWC